MANRCECCGKLVDIGNQLCTDCASVTDDPKLKKVIRVLTSTYARAKKLEYIRNPLAYALYKVWKIADNSK